MCDKCTAGYMCEKPSTVDEAIAYVWDVPDTVIGPADKQSLAAALAEKTDAVARRFFSAPNPELWVGTLRELLKPTGTLSQTQFDSGCNCACEISDVGPATTLHAHALNVMLQVEATIAIVHPQSACMILST